MAKPRIVIVDSDINYIIPLQMKFVDEFFEKIDLEIITDPIYFNDLFSTPQKIDILIISDEFYTPAVHRHNLSHVFVMKEQYEEEQTAELNVDRIFKYTSIKEIFNEIVGKSSDSLRIENNGKQESQIVVVYSANGGTGKTTVAMGICASLTKNYKRVLYLNASHLQVFHNFLENKSSVSSNEFYACLGSQNESMYENIRHVIRKEHFNYIPPFKAALMSLGLDYSIYLKMIESIKKSGDYDYILVDADVTFDEDKAKLLNLADKVMVVLKQDLNSVLATNILVSNMNGLSTDKYYFICNDFDKNDFNALISSSISLKFTVSEYIDHFSHYANMKADDLAGEGSIQKTAFLII